MYIPNNVILNCYTTDDKQGIIIACLDHPMNGPYYVIVDDKGKSWSRPINNVTITNSEELFKTK